MFQANANGTYRLTVKYQNEYLNTLGMTGESYSGGGCYWCVYQPECIFYYGEAGL